MNEYREELRADIVRCAAAVLPEMKGSTLKKVCDSVSLETLREMRDVMRKSEQKNLPLIRQLDIGKENEKTENSEYKI